MSRPPPDLPPILFTSQVRSGGAEGMKTLVSGDKLGTPAKKRSRSISTRKREVGQRISVLSTNTYLRTLSIAVALPKIGEKGTATGQSLVSHKYPHPRATCMLFCTCFDTSYRLQKFRVIIRISNNCKQRETLVAQVARLVRWVRDPSNI